MLSSVSALSAVDLRSGRHVPLLRAEHWNIYQAHFSPDDRWIAFLANTGPVSGRIFVARWKGLEEIPETEWLPITDGKSKVDKPRFSPDGKLIYFTLDGNGTHSVQAVRFDAENGRPIGEPFVVYDFRAPRLSMVPVGLGPLEISVARDKMVMMVPGNAQLAAFSGQVAKYMASHVGTTSDIPLTFDLPLLDEMHS